VRIAPWKAIKAGWGRECDNRTGQAEILESLSKLQARSVDPAAGTDRKISRRCRRAKGRIEKRVSTET